MSTPSVEASHPPTQEDKLLGEYRPTTSSRLTLHDDGSYTRLVRHRMHAEPPEETAAIVEHEGGKVTDIEWVGWHRNNLPMWKLSVEDWIRRKIAEAA